MTVRIRRFGVLSSWLTANLCGMNDSPSIAPRMRALIESALIRQVIQPDIDRHRRDPGRDPLPLSVSLLGGNHALRLQFLTEGADLFLRNERFEIRPAHTASGPHMHSGRFHPLARFGHRSDDVRQHLWHSVTPEAHARQRI